MFVEILNQFFNSNHLTNPHTLLNSSLILESLIVFLFRFIIPRFTIKQKVSLSTLGFTFSCLSPVVFYVILQMLGSDPTLFAFPPVTVELNEVGFKFVRKCINFIETNGKGHNKHPLLKQFSCGCSSSSLKRPEGGAVGS